LLTISSGIDHNFTIENKKLKWSADYEYTSKSDLLLSIHTSSLTNVKEITKEIFVGNFEFDQNTTKKFNRPIWTKSRLSGKAIITISDENYNVQFKDLKIYSPVQIFDNVEPTKEAIEIYTIKNNKLKKQFLKNIEPYQIQLFELGKLI